MISIVKLSYFCDVIDEGGFSKAAQKNHVAQTSISQQIKELENHYQCQLLNRTTRPVTLTESGKVLYKSAKKVFNEFDVLETNMRAFSRNDCSLTIEYASMLDVLSLNELLKNHSEIKCILHKETLGTIAKNLLEGKYDFAVAFDSEFFNEPNLDYRVITQGEYYLAVSKSNPLSQKKEISIDELYQYEAVMLNQDTLGKTYEIMKERSQNKLKIAQMTDDIDSEIFYIKQDNLVGFFPKSFKLILKSEGINLIKIKNSPHVFQVVVSWVKGHLTEEKKKLIAFL